MEGDILKVNSENKWPISRTLLKELKKRVENRYNRRHTQMLAAVWDSQALQQLTPLMREYLPWTKSAMRPSGITTILNCIVLTKPQVVVECGGGVTTFLLGKILNQQGGHLYTVEHEGEWSRMLDDNLRRAGLTETCTIIHAPLRDYADAIMKSRWYDQDALRKELHGLKIDVLIVDGPPAYTEKLSKSRYPAVPFFRSQMSEHCAIFLDDINRKGEAEVCRLWEQQLGNTFQKRIIEGGLAVGIAGDPVQIYF